MVRVEGICRQEASLLGFYSSLTTQVLPPSTDQKAKVLVCGPPGMMNAVSGGKAKDFSQGEVSGILKDLGYTKDQVFKY
jgi:cytochrome-b5 reductase